MARLYIVGIGSGRKESMTLRAIKCLKRSEVVVGYKYYIDLIRDLVKDKLIISSGMKNEIERCKLAIQKVKEGYETSIVSSGDAGLYGMAGLILEIDSKIDFEIVPGVSAAFLAASVLGAPLMHDFCTVSLSDILTPWEVIEKRLKYAAKGDFVIVLYNPKSHSRSKNIEKAVKILLEYKNAKTPVGIVKNAMREGEERIITTLDSIDYDFIDMITTVIVGNSNSYIKDNMIITPRGYCI